MSDTNTTLISGWGRTAAAEGLPLLGEDLVRLSQDANLSRGLGRSYGDAAIPATPGSRVLFTERADRICQFDEETGILRAEAGLSLLQLNAMFLPRRWFVPVTPGTQFVTLGGMVASDVHGKNHHRDGSIGEHVLALKMRLGDGSVVDCSAEENRDLFLATLGGMGLTGHILEVTLRMVRISTPWIYQRCEKLRRLSDMLLRLRDVGDEWPMTVAWIDCLAEGEDFGRGVLLTGRWAETFEAPDTFKTITKRRTLPFEMPGFVLNRQTVKWGLNARHWHGFRNGLKIVHPEEFFYPLDTLDKWNRMYGKRGFIQYQCVLPGDPESGVAQGFFDLMRKHHLPIYLCVLKDMGAAGRGMISFPTEGYTLALDLPNRPPLTQVWVDCMNEYVMAHGGRVYLTKDSHTRAEHFRAMDPRIDAWNDLRRQWDPDGNIKSALSVRLLGDEA